MANKRQGRAEARDGLAPGAFSGTKATREMTAQQIAEEIRKVDLDQVPDPATFLESCETVSVECEASE